MDITITPLASSTLWSADITPTTCSENLLDWLLDQNSLTRKLQALSADFKVKVRQQVTLSHSKDLLSPYFSEENKVLVREVLLVCDNKPVVFAQTEIPFSTLTDQQAKLAEIGTDSLGTFLFQDPSMRRDKIEVAQFPVYSAVHQLCIDLNQEVDFPLWGRRSLFYVNNKPLLVSEVFLPASGIYLP
ncbi:chorismate lyase [Psychromonas ingrahamii 37]|uniref:Probable chorismate pyruvate-lyase n=1 Tax=Psychromonas ingrahamii (strain DSM 17664 / CCUG 51855 / 37) TaxID=357804 RepID=UBIC_PSYIN|nr:chorismate lyase [Psychromonas ingrahamii]A1T086.1 RecName: Full=Probable chorismate pyruvate-lyase; Short=CL; Short=CPL [Psychromonas ingrahamii 37]ABM05151.1 chorismate lyase [Psychromonas ingrahamii 37]